MLYYGSYVLLITIIDSLYVKVIWTLDKMPRVPLFWHLLMVWEMI